jgi:hypothetical protein
MLRILLVKMKLFFILGKSQRLEKFHLISNMINFGFKSQHFLVRDFVNILTWLSCKTFNNISFYQSSLCWSDWTIIKVPVLKNIHNI